MRWPAAMCGTSSRNKTEIFWTLLKCIFPSKGRPAYIADMKAQLGDEEWIKIRAKRSIMTYGIFRTLTMVIKVFQTNLNLVWNMCPGNNFFVSKPKWNWFGKSYVFFGCNFSKPYWIWFGKGHWIKCSCSALWSRWNQNMSDWVTEWQGHLLSCSGQLNKVYFAV